MQAYYRAYFIVILWRKVLSYIVFKNSLHTRILVFISNIAYTIFAFSESF